MNNYLQKSLLYIFIVILFGFIIYINFWTPYLSDKFISLKQLTSIVNNNEKVLVVGDGDSSNTSEKIAATALSVKSSSVEKTNNKFPPWMKWGAYVGWQDDSMDKFESLVGKNPQMQAVFAHWGNDDFPSFYSSLIRDKGRTMVLFWEAIDYSRDPFSQDEYSFDSVIKGDMDSYFTKFAAESKEYKGDIILIPYSEFNGNWFPWGVSVKGNTPQKFIEAWIHIRKIFKDVPNVKFAWVPNNDPSSDISINNIDYSYPGSQYVDIVGLDGFNADPWETFDQMMGSELNHLKKYNKPIYIFSMGVKEDSRKASWITDTFTVQLYKYPEVKGWIWFNENKENDWRVNSDQDSLNAFKDMIP